MLKKKGFIGIAIFIVMFATAWWGNGINERYYHVDTDFNNDGVQLLKVDPETSPEEQIIWLEPFKPREYIRVQNHQPYIYAE